MSEPIFPTTTQISHFDIAPRLDIPKKSWISDRQRACGVRNVAPALAGYYAGLKYSLRK